MRRGGRVERKEDLSTRDSKYLFMKANAQIYQNDDRKSEIFNSG